MKMDWSPEEKLERLERMGEIYENRLNIKGKEKDLDHLS